MSFVDLATISIHRRQEMENRINSFQRKCDQTINHIKKLKEQARSLVHQLNCDPKELKERYLKCIMQLEEYIYLITDIDLAVVDKLGEKPSIEYTPVLGTNMQCLTPTLVSQPLMSQPLVSQPLMSQPLVSQPFNIMDVLSEPVPSTSTACSNFCAAEKDKPRKHRNKTSKEETLIVFSSASCSNESMLVKNESPHSKSPSPNKRNEHSNYKNGSSSSNTDSTDSKKVTSIKNETLNNTDEVRSEAIKLEKEVRSEMVDSLEEIDAGSTSSSGEEVENISLQAENLPAQSLLEENQVYPATIISVDGTSFWVVLYSTEDFSKFTEVMTQYYNDPLIATKGLDFDVHSLTYCAFYDNPDTNLWYRGILIFDKEEEADIQVYLVDTGEFRTGDLSVIRPLAAAFFDRPPYAYCCHLAGIELSRSEEDQREISLVLREYIATPCSIRIDDNTSESLGVYVLLSEDESLGDVLVNKGLAHLLEEPAPPRASSSLTTDPPTAGPPTTGPPTTGPPEACGMTDSELELLDMDCPEHEDPVEAVTGYSNRDEAEICKHYKGGPDKTCFKGSRCRKRHVMHHPDGWTLDKMEVVAKCPSLPLPAPDSWLRVYVTCVQHFDTMHVQVVRDDADRDFSRSFGVLRPPSTLASLIMDMNSPAQKLEYKRFTIAPAVGELAAAIYPLDGQYYRARVLVQSPADQNVEVTTGGPCLKVFYLDYGNTISVREDKLFVLPERHAALPAQAILCRLAGVHAKTTDSKQWAAAKKALSDLVLEQTLEAHVIARDYDEITVELFDKRGVSIAEELASKNMVNLFDFSVIDDSNVIHKLVVP